MLFPPLGCRDPYIVFRGFPHTHLAALLWGPHLAVERLRHAPQQHRSELDSRLRWKSGERSSIRKTSSWHITQHRIRRVSSRGVAEKIGSTPLWRTSVHNKMRVVTWSFGTTFVGIDPLEANLVASCSRPCPCFGGVPVHLHVPQKLYFLLTSSFDLTWVQWSALDIVLSFPFLKRCFVSINRNNFQLRQRQTMLRRVRHSGLSTIAENYAHDRLAHRGRVSR